ncbi:hypothetical protein PV08_05511 [Exophiala spinifera]|uniref:RING-type domain-containing protein n=1 Tax=Exophiala spinifera TaxID=91928 RepID=A0A0D2BA59_9EURO|nr:uncharacterized protein PV08_05511 [Exophiala spinifera]KIW15465.1 hypothetical protein PV08_05511 [Exophiala spinifera]
MASSQNSPVLVQHSSPPHRLSPEVALVSIPPYNPETSPLQEPSLAEQPLPGDESSSESEPATPTPEMADTPMVDIPPPEGEELDTAVSNERNNVNTEEPSSEPEATQSSESLPQEAEVDPSAVNETSQEPPRVPPEEQQVRDEPPEWATREDDHSTPTEDEMTELNLRESKGQELSALDVPSVEKRIYQDVDDPDQRPVKKLRLSWIIKGVRGTRENPNRDRVMVSPPAKVDGNYWQIKFYPRGNKSVFLSAYIKCSRRPPPSGAEYADGTFSCFEGPPNADLSNGFAPSQVIHHQTSDVSSERPHRTHPQTTDDSQKEQSGGSQESGSAQAGHGASAEDTSQEQDLEEDWRVSAQLGMVMYNPEEPRTCHVMSSEHQFARTNDDWGWTNFTGPWDEIHVRGHLQRAPLLRNDTIAIDAYIRIFDDPTQALWWHSSEAEFHWDSKALAGYFPMGTPPLYHSPAVAGITSWLLLYPIRKVLQEANAVEWRQNSQVRPRPIVSHMQMILFLMRHLRKERENYVDVYPAIHAIRELGETYNDVKTFWEVLRRTIELELEGDENSLKQLRAILDTPNGPLDLPSLPVENISDVQEALTQVLRSRNFRGQLPDFLPLALARQHFDKTKRVWKLLHDRVALNEELDMAEFCPSIGDAKYTLYGFVVHLGERNSGKFYSVLRPGGPNSKWLAFEDGDGNKVFSYTRKRISQFEGLEGQALKDATAAQQTAYMVMYIRTSRLGEYLPGKLEPYKLPKSLLPYLESQHHGGEFVETPQSMEGEDVKVELYSDQAIIGRQGLLDMFNIKRQCEHKGLFHIMKFPRTATYQELRRQLAEKLGIENTKAIRLFLMSNTGLGHYVSAQMQAVDMIDLLPDTKGFDQPFCLWYSILKTEEDIKLFGVPDRVAMKDVVKDVGGAARDEQNSSQRASSVVSEEQLAAPDLEQASLQEAVSADVENARADRQSVAQAVEISDPDTPMQLEPSPPPTIEESLVAEVPHGHLIDALAQGAMTVPSLSVAEAEVIADTSGSFDATNTNVMELSVNEQDEPNPSNAGNDGIPQSAEGPVEQAEGPVDNVYGFIQIFDADNQTFYIHDTFFARYDDKIKEKVRDRMRYDAHSTFPVWRREGVVGGSAIHADETFRDRRFINGCDLIVAEPVSETRITQLHLEGKFSNPFDLSKYLRMVDRKHPVLSKTSEEPIELGEFGADYYKGPLVNGRMHGERALCISSTGHMYEGPLVCSKRCGKGGKMTYQNGDTYEGDWEDDERHGQGTFVEQRTGNKYVGGFEYGKRWGMGTTYWQVADEQADLCQICYGQEIDALFFDCGHVCSCVECARQCDICPICRRSVKQVVKMFRA